MFRRASSKVLFYIRLDHKDTSLSPIRAGFGQSLAGPVVPVMSIDVFSLKLKTDKAV